MKLVDEEYGWMAFDTVDEALADRLGHGGWFFYNTDDGHCEWFDFTHTRDDVMSLVRGTGLVATWNQLEAAVHGPIGGPRGRKAEPLG